MNTVRKIISVSGLALLVLLLGGCPNSFGYFPEEEDRVAPAETSETAPPGTVSNPYILTRKAGSSDPFEIVAYDPETVNLEDSSSYFSYQEDQEIILRSRTEDALILYTLNGSSPAPGAAGTLSFSEDSPITDLKGNLTSLRINALGLKSLLYPSSEVNFGLRIEYERVATPSFSLLPGAYDSDQLLSISTQTNGAAIYYRISLDPETPAADPLPGQQGTLLYEGPISLSGDGSYYEVKAIAVLDQFTDSRVVSGSWSIDYPDAPAPSISPASGSKEQAISISMSTNLAGAEIYYSYSDDPNIEPPTPEPGNNLTTYLYTGPISLPVSTIYRKYSAITVKAGYSNSAVQNVVYSFMLQAPAFQVNNDLELYGRSLVSGGESLVNAPQTANGIYRVSLSSPPPTGTWDPQYPDQETTDLGQLTLPQMADGEYTAYIRYFDGDLGAWSAVQEIDLRYAFFRHYPWAVIDQVTMSTNAINATDGLNALVEAVILSGYPYYDRMVLDMRGVSGTFVLEEMLQFYGSEVVLLGPEDNSLILSGGNVRRVMAVKYSNDLVQLEHMGISNGRRSGVAGTQSTGLGGGGGGAGVIGAGLIIHANANTVVRILDSSFSDNQAYAGAGGSATTALTVSDGADGAFTTEGLSFYTTLQFYTVTDGQSAYGPLNPIVPPEYMVGDPLYVPGGRGGIGNTAGEGGAGEAANDNTSAGGGGGAGSTLGGAGGLGGYLGGGGGAGGWTENNFATVAGGGSAGYGGAGGSVSARLTTAGGGGGAALGAAIAMTRGALLEIRNTTFSGNIAQGGAGGLSSSGGSNGNAGLGKGAAIMAPAGKLQLTGVTFQDNSSSGHGNIGGQDDANVFLPNDLPF